MDQQPTFSAVAEVDEGRLSVRVSGEVDMSTADRLYATATGERAEFLTLDLRHRLFLGRAPGPALLVLAIGLVFFLAWDLFGIGLGIFFRAETEFMTGILLAPELPLEEPVFLLFLCELTMVLVCGAERWLARGRAGAA